MSSISGTMLVTLSVEVAVGPWGGAATFDSLYEQAEREAKQKLANITQKDGHVRNVKVISIGAVIVHKEKP